MPEPDFIEDIVVPFQEAIASVARGVAEAQTTLDEASLEVQKRINEDPELAPLGLAATWFQIPEIELEVKISLSIHEEQVTESSPGLFLAFYNASYRNSFDHEIEAASTLKMKIRPVPPPVTQTVPRTVPDLVGKKLSTARRLLEESGLRLGEVNRRRSDESKDTILEQDPPADAQLPSGGVVDLVVSRGPSE